MANEKYLKGRFQQKIDTEENWNKAKNFIPLDGEIIVYRDLNKIKIGDGVSTLDKLQFATGKGSAGIVTEEGGVIFSDYENNRATARGSMAAGWRQDCSGAPDVESEEEVAPEDWRYNEALGTGATANGMGAIAYSRASKSLGYRTQTGYPPSMEEVTKRPEVLHLNVDILNPVEFTGKDYVSVTKNSLTLKHDLRLYIDDGDKCFAIYEVQPKFIPNDAKWLITGKSEIDLSNASLFDLVPSNKLEIKALDANKQELATLYTRIFEVILNDDGTSATGDYGKKDILDANGQPLLVTVPKNTCFIQFETNGGQISGLDGYSVKYKLTELSLKGFPEENEGQAAVAIGSDTVALANNSFAGGYKTQAIGKNAFAFGNNAQSTGTNAISIGSKQADKNTTYPTWAKGDNSVAIGAGAAALGAKTTAIGYCVNSGDWINNEIHAPTQMVLGRFNAKDDNATFIIGNGSGNASLDDQYYNILTTDKEQNIVINGVKTTINSDELKINSKTQIYSDVFVDGQLRGLNNELYATQKWVLDNAQLLQRDKNNNITLTAKRIAMGDENTETTVDKTIAIGWGNPALYKTAAQKPYAIAMGYGVQATGEGSLALGRNTISSGSGAVAMGTFTQASGANSFAAGAGKIDSNNRITYTTASGLGSAAFGLTNKASGNYAFTAGSTCNAQGYAQTVLGLELQSQAQYFDATAGQKTSHFSGQCIVGIRNKEPSYTTQYHSANKNNVLKNYTLFAIGNGSGTLSTQRSNAFEVYKDGSLAATQTMKSSLGADYAEMFEWQDGNPLNEDRVGYAVTLDGEKIRLAQAGDNVLGIISGTAAILGDSAMLEWKHKYITDDFGRIIYNIAEEFTEEQDPETNETKTVSLGFFSHPRINPNYDPNETYIPREERPEWGKVGMLGKLYTRDDGTCVPGGYCAVGADGILTHSEAPTNIRVMKRTSENIVWVLLK